MNKNNIFKISRVLISTAFLSVFLFALVSVSQAKLAETDQKAVEKYNKYKTEYTQAVNVYKSMRQDFLTAKDKYLKSKNAANGADALQKAKDFLVKADEAMIKYLNMLKAKAETVAGITESERQQILSEINSDIAWLEQHKPQIPNATTKEQLTEHGNQMKLHWIKVRVHAKRLAGKILIYRINATIAEGDKIGADVEARIQALKDQGKDTSKLEAWLADFENNLNLAKQKRDAAIAKYDQIGTAGATTLSQLDAELKEADTLLRDGDSFIKDANQYVRAAYKNLKDIAKELKTT